VPYASAVVISISSHLISAMTRMERTCLTVSRNSRVLVATMLHLIANDSLCESIVCFLLPAGQGGEEI